MKSRTVLARHQGSLEMGGCMGSLPVGGRWAGSTGRSLSSKAQRPVGRVMWHRTNEEGRGRGYGRYRAAATATRLGAEPRGHDSLAVWRPDDDTPSYASLVLLEHRRQARQGRGRLCKQPSERNPAAWVAREQPGPTMPHHPHPSYTMYRLMLYWIPRVPTWVASDGDVSPQGGWEIYRVGWTAERGCHPNL